MTCATAQSKISRCTLTKLNIYSIVCKMSIPNHIQAIIDKFSATAESLEDLQTRLGEGLQLGEGWVRDDVFRNLGQELAGHCMNVVASLGEWTPRVVESVERMAKAEGALRDEREQLARDMETLRCSNEQLQGVSKAYSSLSERHEATLSGESEAREQIRRESAQKIKSLMKEGTEQASRIAQLEQELVRERGEAKLKEQAWESDRQSLGADYANALAQEKASFQLGTEQASRIAQLEQELVRERDEAKLKEQAWDSDRQLRDADYANALAQEKASFQQQLAELSRQSERETRSLVERSSGDIAAGLNALSSKVDKVEEVARAGVDTLKDIQGRQAEREHVVNLQDRVKELALRLEGIRAAGRKRENEPLASDRDRNATKVRVFERNADTITPPSSALRRDITGLDRGVPPEAAGFADSSEPSPGDGLQHEISGGSSMPEREGQQPEGEGEQPEGEDQATESDVFADLWPLIDFSVWADRPERVEQFKSEFREAAGSRAFDTGSARAHIDEHVQGNRQTTPQSKCYLAHLRKLGSKCGTKDNPLLTRDGCSRHHNRAGELCVYFLAASGGPARWVLHERT